ncbi:MAG: FAD-dependent oxidoreductase, partial [Caldithrix sp.]|nr:FAD-dependent oxidoreductase [Caldithrix sp.]
DESNTPGGLFDAVILSQPPAQTLPFIPNSSELHRKISAVQMDPCWAVMAVFDQPLKFQYDGLYVNKEAISWMARNSSKPQRPPMETWVIHGAPEWSAENIERSRQEVIDRLLQAFYEITGYAGQPPVYVTAHRWRYSQARNPADEVNLRDDDLKLGVCGDWLNQSRVEGAFLSGLSLANRLNTSMR